MINYSLGRQELEVTANKRDSERETGIDSEIKRDTFVGERDRRRSRQNKLGAVLLVWARSSIVCSIYSQGQLGFG